MNSPMRPDNQLPSLIENFRFGGPIGRDMNELFNSNMPAMQNVPAVNVVEHPDGFRIEVAAPGRKKEDFKLNLHHNNLTISTSQENNRDEKDGEKFTRREFSHTSFQRVFTLPTSVDSESIRANYADGVLKIDLPKREEAKVKPPRLIQIG